MSEHSHGDSDQIFGPSEKLSFLNYLKLFTSLSINYVRQTADKLVVLAVIYSVFSLLAYFLYILIKTYVRDDHNESMKRVLIVTAHPDDECMFFGPTIVNLRARDIPVHLLCLSPGDSVPNSRQVRKSELRQSCVALGLDESLVELKKHSLLMDGHQNEWSHKLIAKMIMNNIEMLNIDTVITFDEMGVSEHPNHIAIFDAMAYLTLNHVLPSNVGFYSLDSVNRLRKYSFMLDFLTSFFLSELCLISSLKQQYQVVKAMSCHRSQFVWYRKLYILLSRYATINTLKTWSRDELKSCLHYQEIVDGMKYKSKWYESLDDSLKKINSEQTISSLVKSDDFVSEEITDDAEDENDADVSFVAKAPAAPSVEPPAPPTLPEPRTRDLLTPSPQPDPRKLAANESIHNGEVYVRKSRFLIPKTYGSFYNSSSSEASDDKDDGETSSSSNTSLDKIKAQDGEEMPLTPSSISSEEASHGKLSDSHSSGEMARTSSQSSEDLARTPSSDSGQDVVDMFNVKNTNSDSTLLCTDTDVTVDNEDDDEVLENNISYEIEDIESVLNEFDDSEEEINKYNGNSDIVRDVLSGMVGEVVDREKITKASEQILECDNQDLILELDELDNKVDLNREIVMKDGIEKEINKTGDKTLLKETSCKSEGDVLDYNKNTSNAHQSGEKMLRTKDIGNMYPADNNVENDGDLMNICTSNAKTTSAGIRIEDNVTNVSNNHKKELVGAIHDVQPNETVIRGSIVDPLSSNSSEQESAIDEQTSDTVSTDNAANDLNKRNKKKRKNKKNKKKSNSAVTSSDKLAEKVQSKDTAELPRSNTMEKKVHKTLKRDKNENNNTICDGKLGENDKQSHSNDNEHTNGTNHSLNKEGSGSSKLPRTALGENNQNIFNVDVGSNSDENVIHADHSTPSGAPEITTSMQPVSTN